MGYDTLYYPYFCGFIAFHKRTFVKRLRNARFNAGVPGLLMADALSGHELRQGDDDWWTW